MTRPAGRGSWGGAWAPLIVLTLLGVAAVSAAAQAPETRAPAGEFLPPTPGDGFQQDPARNNLVHPSGYVAAPPNTLGRVDRHGEGAVPVILVAGLGFSGRVFEPLLETMGDEYTAFVVTLAGYGGSSAPPMPPPGTSYAERTWLAGAQRGLGRLIADEELDRPILVALYSDAANVVTHYASEHPDRVGGVLLLSASARFPLPSTGPSRAERIDGFTRQWFRTVTEIMWPSGMFGPEYYATSREVAEAAWWEVLEPTLATSIRYTVETWADDLVPVAARVSAPMIVLSPDLAFLPDDSRARSVVRFHTGWEQAIDAGAGLEHRIVPGARFLVWEDAPDAVPAALRELAAAARSERDPPRP